MHTQRASTLHYWYRENTLPSLSDWRELRPLSGVSRWLKLLTMVETNPSCPGRRDLLDLLAKLAREGWRTGVLGAVCAGAGRSGVAACAGVVGGGVVGVVGDGVMEALGTSMKLGETAYELGMPVRDAPGRAGEGGKRGAAAALIALAPLAPVVTGERAG